jgi:hypothetical protein
MDGTSIPKATITLNIAGSSNQTLPNTGELRQGPRPIFASIFPIGMFGMVVAGGMGGRKRRAVILLLFVVLAMVLLSIGCGTNGASTKSSIAPGTYQVTVTAATSGTNAVSHSVTISLTVS